MSTKHLVTAKSIKSNTLTTGFVCSGLLLNSDGSERRPGTFLVPEYPDLRETTIGCVYMHGFIEIDPDTIRKVE